MTTSDDLAQVKPARSKFGPKLTEHQKRAIVASFTLNGSMTMTAQEHGVHRNTVACLVNGVRNNVKDSVISTQWRAPMLAKAVTGVNAGLDCTDDPYKRANIGVQVLKGLGEFNADSQVNVVAMLSNVPAGLDLSAGADLQVIEPLPVVSE